MSAKTGRAPQRTIELAEAKKVNGVVSTKSPGRTPAAAMASHNASVPLAQATVSLTPRKRRDFPFQRGNLFAKNQALRLANPVDGLANFGANGGVLPLEIE